MWVAVEDVCVGAGRVVAGVCWVNANVVVWREGGRVVGRQATTPG